MGSPVYGWNYPNIATWNVGETSEIDGKIIHHNTIISNIKKYSNENSLTEEDFVLTSNGHYRGIKYSDGIFSYLGTNEESDAEMPGMEKGTTNPEKIIKYMRKYPDLVYTGKKDEARTTSYNGGSSPHIITNDDGSTFQMFSITYDSSNEYYDFHLTGNHTGFSFRNFEGNDDIGYYYNTYQAFGGFWRIDKAIYWYFNEWDGVEGAVTE